MLRAGLIVFVLLCTPFLQLKAAVELSPACTVIYSLQRSAQQYFIDETTSLSEQLIQQNIGLIDLNNWYERPPFVAISGRERSQLREQYQLPVNQNQAVVVDSNGREISRITGSVTLVDAILSCPA